MLDASRGPSKRGAVHFGRSVGRAIIVVSASLAWAACSVAGPNAASLVDEGQDFSLRIGESVQTRDGTLRIGFEGVTADSRCPKGEQCISAGDATARFWIQEGAASKATRDLHTASNAEQSTRAGKWFIRLVRLEPFRITGKTIASAHYVATLSVSHNSSDATER